MFKTIKIIIAQKLQKRLQRMANNRPPDFTVGNKYLKRWYILPRNPLFNIYYHCFQASDDPRFLHDHFYINCSILTQGSYIEHTVDGPILRQAGDIKIRLPKTLHRIEIQEGDTVYSLFITGPRVRMWGFMTDKGWMNHTQYMKVYGVNPNI